MNDLDIHGRNDAILDRPDTLARYRHIEKRLKRQNRRRWGGRAFALGGFLLLAGGLSFGTWGNYAQQQAVAAIAKQERDLVPSLRVATVEASPSTLSVTLPGTTTAFAAANIYAHVSGYISNRKVDIGDRIKKGQELAQIDPRPYQAALDRATAQRAHDQALLDQAQKNLERYQFLGSRNSIPQQQVDDQTYLVAQDKSTVALDQANVETAQLNLQYTQIIAPFDAVITARNVDVGDLVQADATSGTFMFTLMRSDVVRIQLYVPQSEAIGVAPGANAVFRVPELPNRTFPGKVTRTADALQPGTRTLLTEVDVPNPDGALAPGMYGTVELHVPRKSPSLSVPAEAMIFNHSGMQVAVVRNGKAEIRNIHVARDFGTRVDVDSGIEPGDQVILNPPINLVDGGKVQVRADVADLKP
jgi:RND family efflux transporter MFP subunit